MAGQAQHPGIYISAQVWVARHMSELMCTVIFTFLVALAQTRALAMKASPTVMFP